jgi:anthranilate phosphoribosyltransferase
MSLDMSDLKSMIGHVAEGKPLSADSAQAAFEIIMSGDATPAQIGGLLMALRVRGETVDEITGAARVMREKALKIKAPEGAIDIVGTGGDAHGTHNISTATAFVVAACGVPVAKHGNRAFSSKSGAADVLDALGVNVDAPVETIERALFEAGITFLMAPKHHSAMRNVGGPRVELGVRTIFNLLGPLSNPALVKRQLVGVYDLRWIEPLAHVLGNLGLERAWVVHGSDGMDELTTTGETHVAELKDGKVSSFTVAPGDIGVRQAALSDLRGGTPEENAAAIRALFDGAENAFRDIVVLNAAAALVIAGKADDLAAGAELAREAMTSRAALGRLDALVGFLAAAGEAE